MGEERNCSSIMREEIERAVRNDEFRIFLQPQVNAANRGIVGFEALIRWEHPARGILLPGEFLGTVRALHMIESLDFMVFEKVCTFLEDRQQENRKLFCISCNFDREHFVKSDFASTLENIRRRFHVPARYLAVEIVEGSAFFDEETVQQNVKELDDYGFPVYLDDYGAAQSAFGDILFHNISHIKVDKNLVDHIEQENAQVLLDGLCSIAHRLSYLVVCEGIENRRQLELVKKCGADIIQGFYFYHPMQPARAACLYDQYAH